MTPAEHRFVPYRLSSLCGHRVLVLAPHPDDESFGCGGSLRLHRQSGDPVKVVFLTDGAQGTPDAALTPGEVRDLREREARCACRVLGISDLEFWRVPDRSCRPDARLHQRLSGLLESFRPTLVYAPSPHEFHPDHRGAARLLWEALQRNRTSIKVAFYEINRPFKINTLVDISPVLETKRRACDSYRSQLRSIPYTDLALSLGRFRSLTVSALSTHAEGFLVMQLDGGPLRSLDAVLLDQFLAEQDATTSDRPLVSVVIRTRNRPDLLRQALLSVAAQTHRPIEVVVVNDGGADVAPIVAEQEASLSMRFRDLRRRRGRSAAANVGLELAHGELLLFLDDDDLLYPRHIERLVAHLAESGARVAHSDCEIGRYRSVRGEPVRTDPKTPFLPPGSEPDPGSFDRDRLYRDNYIPLMTVLFSAELLTEVGGFDEELEIYEDWDLLLRVAEKTPLHRVPGITAEYRHFEGRVGHDFRTWRGRLYAKHRDYWTTERLTGYAWSVIERLQDRVAALEAADRARREASVLHRALRAPLGRARRGRLGRWASRSTWPRRLARLWSGRPVPSDTGPSQTDDGGAL